MLLKKFFCNLPPVPFCGKIREKGGVLVLELTEAECLELEKRVSKKFSGTDDEPAGKLGAAIAKIAIAATISTIREYERMKAQKQSD